MKEKQTTWADGTILYQIYPRSFCDSNDDGVGDLNGVASKLDYLADLGVNAIWLTPFYPSPMVDLGYDISDYCDVDPLFGSLEDFKNLLANAHARDIRLLVDLVPNHTSDQHPWFLESRKSKDNPKRDWYVWRKPKNGQPPNNWQSVFGGSAWKFDETSGQYYLHSFLEQQPDLNWDNPAVRDAIKDVMRFWLDLGADGFRADAVSYISKDFSLNQPEREDGDGLLALNNQYGPNLYKYLDELAGVLAEYEGKFMVTEAYADEMGAADVYYDQFYSHVDPNVVAPFNFQAIHKPWQASAFARFINDFQNDARKSYVPVYVLGNHDNPRLATRFGASAARTAAVLQLTLPGMPVIYYGDELGMSNGDAGDINKNHPSSDLARYPARTPMQWDASANAGFSSAKPWLPVNPNYSIINVAHESADASSMLNLYKKLISLRKISPALNSGSYRPLNLTNPEIFGYERESGGEKLVILLNFSNESQQLEEKFSGQLVLSSSDRTKLNKDLTLAPNEGLIIKLS